MRADSSSTPRKRQTEVAAWKEIVAQYQKPAISRALWQMVNTLGLYAALWYLMYCSFRVSWWLTVPLAILAGAVLVRVFIIFHDCGHGSFFKWRRANNFLGFITGVLTFTPYYHWRGEHALHHATAGDLDQRGTGDLWTLTVQEYLEQPVTLFASLKSLTLRLWDEQRRKLVGYRCLRDFRRQQNRAAQP